MTPGNKTAHQGYIRFVEAVSAGEIEPGSSMTQSQLCAVLDMSLTPLRETLILLEEYGLVTSKPRAGLTVVFPDVSFYRENIQFRTMIETYCLKTGIERFTRDWLEAQKARHARGAELLADESAFEAAKTEMRLLDQQFHTDIVGILQNRSVSFTHEHVFVNLRISRQVHRKSEFRQQLIDTVGEHMAVLDAIEDKDASRAVAALERHFQASTHRTFS